MFFKDLVSWINDEIPTSQLLAKNIKWRITSYILSSNLSALHWALFTEAYLTPKKLAKELSDYTVDIENRKLIAPSPLSSLLTSANLLPTNQFQVKAILSIFLLKITFSNHVNFLTCVQLEIGYFFLQGIDKEILTYGHVNVQLINEEKGKFLLLVKKKNNKVLLEEFTFHPCQSVDSLKKFFFKSLAQGAANCFTYNEDFLQYFNEYRNTVNCTAKMCFLSVPPEQVRTLWLDICPELDSDIVYNCIQTQEYVVLVLQTKLVFVRLTYKSADSLFNNIGYGQKIDMKINTNSDKINYRYSFDDYNFDYELVNLSAGNQRQLNSFTVDRDMANTYDQGNNSININQTHGNAKTLSYLYRRIKCIATASIELGNAIVPVVLIYLQPFQQQRNVRLFSINHIHANLKRDMLIVSRLQTMNYVKCNVEDLVSKGEVVFIYKPDNGKTQEGGNNLFFN